LKSDDSEERIQGKERKNKAQIQGKGKENPRKQRFCKFPAALPAGASVNYG
jgi:hypothetical protein